ncbi:NAD(P)H-binding protein [Salegentibacter sp. F188]|uniref:NAD(P)H-binding protein n=1 Tax=Autumnicola patrickiae TaxID=3075591 RepID=A0ABU3E714_9FLAO|nr:NAD(P)H-binding protein [Salegentibacter sp. F188]MDT0691017.1 NAD(P)H-binding protein [Salegentibacter sp. F188]
MGKQQKVLVAGASGSLGLEIVKILNAQGRPVRALTSSDEGEEKLIPYTNDIWKADASNSEEVANITEGVGTVISALGNSVSLFTPNEKSFYKIDFESNQNILRDAEKNGVKRFVYTSIKGADVEKDFAVARSHKLFEQALQGSDLDHTIIRPVGFFSGLNDLIIMAKRKVIPIIGDGSAKTNSIHHADLAKVICSYVDEGPDVIEVGGPKIHTRLEMAEMIQDTIGGQIVKVPEVIADIGLKLPNFFEDIHEKLDYFKYVTTTDMLGEKNGDINFKEYLANLDKNQLP